MSRSSTQRRGVALAVVLGALAIVALLVVQSLASSGVGGDQTSSSMESTSVQQTPSFAQNDFAEHMRLLASGNVSSLVEEYQKNASLVWLGEAPFGLKGSYNGTLNIDTLLRAFYTKIVNGSMAISNQTSKVVATSGSTVTLNSTFDFSGKSSLFGSMNGTVFAQDSYGYANSTWLITHEVWNFTRYTVQYPVITGGPGPAASPTQSPDAISMSADGKYAAIGMTDSAGKNGSVVLLSLRVDGARELWRHVTNNTAIDTVAVSANGSYVVAGGYWSGMTYGDGEIFFFNQAGQLLWNYSTGANSPVFDVAISSSGSRIAADCENQMMYFNPAGDVLWNYTFPYGGTSTHFAMSSDGGSIAYAEGYVLAPGETNYGWAVGDLNAEGQQVWNYTGQDAGVNFVQMSSDGSSISVGTLVSGYNGSVFYFDGADGALLWSRQAYTAVQPLVMSPDGEYVASGGNVGTLLFNSKGDLLWNSSTLGQPVAILPGDSLVILEGGSPGTQLVGYDGKVLATFDASGMVAASQTGPEWVQASGSLGPGSCSVLRVYDGLSQVASTELCPAQ